MSDRAPWKSTKPTEEKAGSAAEAEDRLLAFADRLRRSNRQEEELRETAETWVAFRLAAAPYALPVTHVEELAEIGKITGVPGAPSSVCGVASLRGQVIPIVDLKEHLGLAAEGSSDQKRALIVDHQGRRIGLVVDRVDRVFKLLPSLIKSVPPSDSERSSGRVGGFYEVEGVTLALLNADTFLDRFGETSDRQREQTEGRVS